MKRRSRASSGRSRPIRSSRWRTGASPTPRARTTTSSGTPSTKMTCARRCVARERPAVRAVGLAATGSRLERDLIGALEARYPSDQPDGDLDAAKRRLRGRDGGGVPRAPRRSRHRGAVRRRAAEHHRVVAVGPRVRTAGRRSTDDRGQGRARGGDAGARRDDPSRDPALLHPPDGDVAAARGRPGRRRCPASAGAGRRASGPHADAHRRPRRRLRAGDHRQRAQRSPPTTGSWRPSGRSTSTRSTARTITISGSTGRCSPGAGEVALQAAAALEAALPGGAAARRGAADGRLARELRADAPARARALRDVG